jgi:hypothetical protein
MRDTSKPLDSRRRHYVWVILVIARVLAYQGNCRVAGALRFAPFRSSGFGMSCREHVVELAGAGDAQRTLSGGLCAPAVMDRLHGPW